MNTLRATPLSDKPKAQLCYSSVWRWHFYAGLFCIPFAIWLSITGSIYLFKPQIEAWLDYGYQDLGFSGESASPSQQVEAAIAVIPGSVLNAYQLPETSYAAVQILVGQGANLHRVYVHPQTLDILKIDEEDLRPMQVLFHLHGDMLMGDKGSMLMELAASWLIVLIITGLYLWWPRNSRGVAGLFYPRWNRGSRFFWRDLHAITGFWVSFFLLFLLITGLPWAKSWGSMLKQVRQFEHKTEIKQDWSTGRSSELDERKAANTAPVAHTGEHAEHVLLSSFKPMDYRTLDHIVTTVQPLALAYPVLISPPSEKNSTWIARSDTQNRPLRVILKLDAGSGQIVERQEFSQRALLDRIIGYGVAVHEGQLFGWFNQALGLFTALGVILIAISAVVLWWGRRPAGTLGAPALIANRPSLPIYFYGVLLLLAVLLPLFGISLLLILLIEYAVLRRIARVRKFMAIS